MKHSKTKAEGDGESKQLKNALFYHLYLAYSTETLTIG